jgi:hypothetical protein
MGKQRIEATFTWLASSLALIEGEQSIAPGEDYVQQVAPNQVVLGNWRISGNFPGNAKIFRLPNWWLGQFARPEDCLDVSELESLTLMLSRCQRYLLASFVSEGVRQSYFFDAGSGVEIVGSAEPALNPQVPQVKRAFLLNRYLQSGNWRHEDLYPVLAGESPMGCAYNQLVREMIRLYRGHA